MGTVTQEEIPLDKLIGMEQVRPHMDADALHGLSQSMTESGLLAPIQVLRLENGKYRVIFGHRRVEAAREAGWTTISAVVEPGALADGDILIRQLVENIQRENLSPVAAARGIAAWMKATGSTAAQAASKLGMAGGTVSKLLALLSLPQELQERIDSGALPATTAYELTKVENTDLQKQIACDAAARKLTREQVASAVKQSKQRRRQARKPRPIRVTARLAQREIVSVSADGLDLTMFVSILERMLARAQEARGEGLTLAAMLKRLPAAKPVTEHAAAA